MRPTFRLFGPAGRGVTDGDYSILGAESRSASILSIRHVAASILFPQVIKHENTFTVEFVFLEIYI